MKKEFKLKFNFKGKRDYVQGPDILDNVMETLEQLFPEMTQIKYSAHGWLRKNANLILSDHYINELAYNSLITFYSNDEQYFAYVIDNGEKITDKIEYSEEIVNTKSIINDKIIEFENILDYTFTEIVVSMNKHYMQSAITKEGKWIVTKIEYNNHKDIKNSKNKMIKIKLISNFKNKLTKSSVYINGIEVGFVYFSLI